MSESVSSSYLNYRHEITTRYINQLKQDKEEKEKKELQTRSYLSKYSQELIQKMFNKTSRRVCERAVDVFTIQIYNI